MNCIDCKKNKKCWTQLMSKLIGITDFKCSHFVKNKKYKSFNINDYIRFKINPEYENDICDYWSNIYKSKETLDSLFGKSDEEGCRTCQTWAFIKYISPFIQIDKKTPIETTVYFESKSLY